MARMMFSWSIFATLSVLAAALHWLVARASITKRFWDAIWLPERIDALLKCPACSGFWLGLWLGAEGIRPMVTGYVWVDVPLAGIAAMFGVPVAEGLMLWGLRETKIH
jgi:hypothetical protein